MRVRLVKNYKAVTVHFTAKHWGGLRRRANSLALLDGSVSWLDGSVSSSWLDGSVSSSSAWWYAVGSSVNKFRSSNRDGYPGADRAEAQVELRAMCYKTKCPAGRFLSDAALCLCCLYASHSCAPAIPLTPLATGAGTTSKEMRTALRARSGGTALPRGRLRSMTASAARRARSPLRSPAPVRPLSSSRPPWAP